MSIKQHIYQILQALGEDPSREGLENTPSRVESSLKYLTSGYAQNPGQIISKALFKSTNTQLITVLQTEFYSLCEHHLLPFFGQVHVGYVPDGQVIGLSKIPRLIDAFAHRLQIQENFCEQIADALFTHTRALGVGVVVDARHLCMQMRGVQKASPHTQTASFRGSFLDENSLARGQFLAQINACKA